MKLRRWLAGLLTAAAVLGCSVPAMAAGTPLTRGEACAMLVAAADDYNPGVTAADVMHGDETGALHEDRAVTRVEALVMLSRAFGDLPEPVGDSARWAYDAGNFTDIPAWAQAELEDVWDAGIVAGTTPTTFSARSTMTKEQLELLIDRVYALEGTNLKDDFYTAVNKAWLDTSEIRAGYTSGGTITDMTVETDERVAGLIEEIVNSTPAAGTGAARVKNLYESILDWDSRNAAGAAPIQPWLDAIDGADSLDALMEVHNTLIQDAAAPTLLGFSLTADAKDSSKNVLMFSTIYPTLGAESTYEDDTLAPAFRQYLQTLLVLSGETETQAAYGAARYFDIEKDLAGHMMDSEDYSDVDAAYNLYTMDQLQAMFPQVDLQAILDASGFVLTEPIVVSDPELLKAMAAYFTPDHLEDLKLAVKVGVLAGFAGALSRDFQDAEMDFESAMSGMEISISDEDLAAQQVQASLSDDLGKIYVERYFSAQAKADVEAMIEDFRDIFAQRIRSLDWMSDTTKAKAIEKLEAMAVNVGYPDVWDDTLDGVDLRSPAQGGSYFENSLAMSLAARDAAVESQMEPVDKDAWQMPVYTVNAYYDAVANSINFPAAILQAPLYDVTADATDNLGGIGYVIAHEITHAFDDAGAQYDAEGNVSDWWTEEDYAAFQQLCNDVVDFYDGVEIIPGVICDGELTLSENVADLGALACITAAESREANPDYAGLYEAAARTWRCTYDRTMLAYLATTDVHSPDKLRGSRPLQSCDEFYEAFDIQPGDGMYVAPEDRVQIW